MPGAPRPPDEADRLATLRALGILDTAAEERFDRLTRLACRLFGVPIALVSLIDEERQWFKACVGLDSSETSRDVSFCAHAVAANETLVVQDAGLDPIFADYPSVIGDPFIRFYAGQPLRAVDGQPVGTLCVADRCPRDFTDEDRAALRDLAAAVEDELNAVQIEQALDSLVDENASRRAADMRASMLHAITRVLADADTIELATPSLLRAVCDTLDWDFGALWVRDEAVGRLRYVAHWHRVDLHAPRFVERTRGAEFAPGEGLPGRVWSTGMPAWIPDVRRDGNFPRAGAAESDGIRSAFAFPITGGAETLGVLDFASREVREADGELLLMLGGVGGQIGQFIKRREAEAALRRVNDEMARANTTLLEEVAERHRAELSLARQYADAERARTQTRAILDATSEAMVMVDPGGRISTVNQRFVELFNFPAERLLGVALAERGASLQARFVDENGAVEQIVDSVEDREHRFTRILRQRPPDERELELYSTPVRGDDGVYLGRLYVLRDITREREVDRMKTEFVSLVSHELRTPLTSIKGYVDLLLEDDVGDLNVDQREFLEIVSSNADRLVALINDLLDVSRIESGKVELRREPLDLAALLRATVASFRPQIDAKAQVLDLDIAEHLPTVVGDQHRVTQIVTNLLSNAHKYTPNGGRVRAAARAEPDGRFVRVDVEDSGIGLSDDEQQRLFERFFRSANRVVQEAGGTGLGLTITRSLVEMHGGEITVRSAPGEGSTFSFTLPTTTRQAASDETDGDVPRGTGRILVVDDEPDIAHLVRRYLERSGYSVSLAHTAAEALQQARSARPDLITLDLNLPDMDGFSALEWLKRDAALRHVPVLILSIMPDDGRGRRLGAVDYLNKPLDERTILRRVRSILAAEGKRHILVADDEADVRRLLAEMLRRHGYRVDEAADGEEAVALARSLRPDLLLLDVKMPRLDGIEALRVLRGDPAVCDLPVIMMTASPGVLETRRGDIESLGVETLLAKPLTPEELAREIARGLAAGGEP